MNYSTQTYLYIDATIGRVGAFVLDRLARILNIIRCVPRDIPQAPKCIVISKFMGIGSIVQAFPFLKYLRKRYPTTRILLVTFKDNEVFSQLLSAVDKAYFIDKSTLLSLAVTTFKALRLIKNEKPTITIDLEVYSSFSRILTFLIFSPYRLGFFLINTISRKGIFTHLLYFNRFQHISRVYKNMAYLAGVPKEYVFDNEELTDMLKIPFDSEQEAEKILRGLGVKDKKIIFININASDLCIERRWPADCFSILIKQLLKLQNTAVILIGADKEWEYNQKCIEQINAVTGEIKVHNIAGRSSLPVFLALLKMGDLLVTNDSGPMHLGDLMGCPTVSLWGPGTPQSYAPQNSKHIVIYHSVYCSPCLYMINERPCGGDNICMRSITPQEVFEACVQVLDWRKECVKVK